MLKSKGATKTRGRGKRKIQNSKLKTMSNSSVTVADGMVIDLCLLCFAVGFLFAGGGKFISRGVDVPPLILCRLNIRIRTLSYLFFCFGYLLNYHSLTFLLYSSCSRQYQLISIGSVIVNGFPVMCNDFNFYVAPRL
jgi:hypothetical protein